MSMEAVARRDDVSLTVEEQLCFAREVLHIESRALEAVAERLNSEFCLAVQLLFECRGYVVVSGMGKASIIGQKIAATLASTGTPSHFLHPAEALHGDLGRLRVGDVMVLLSRSGETEEIVRLLPSLAELNIPIVALTCNGKSTLARAATVVIELGRLSEACPLGLAPTTSTTAMLAVGDALALVLSRMRGFTSADFARLHPGGDLGFRLSKVEQHMRPLSRCRLAHEGRSLREVLVAARLPGRRTGATMLVDDAGRLSGIFTDSDLARLFEDRRDGDLDRPIRELMTNNPLQVESGTLMSDAMTLMAERKISELPVVDKEGKPLGLLDITDILALLPRDSAPAGAAAARGWRIVVEAEE